MPIISQLEKQELAASIFAEILAKHEIGSLSMSDINKVFDERLTSLFFGNRTRVQIEVLEKLQGVIKSTESNAAS